MRESLLAGKSPIRADETQRQALAELSQSHDRGEVDRARAVLLTLSGWTGGRMAEAFGVGAAFSAPLTLWLSMITADGLASLPARLLR